MRYLLMVLCGKKPSTYVLTAELGSQGLLQGLRAISATQSAEIAAAIKAVCKYYETLRAYRNYYVHGLTAIAYSDGHAIGAIAMMEAKEVLRIAEDRITLSEVQALTEQSDLLRRALSALLDTVEPREGSMAHPVLPTSQSLHPPGALKKTLRYPLGPPAV
jgi:hypothetical protein